LSKDKVKRILGFADISGDPDRSSESWRTNCPRGYDPSRLQRTLWNSRQSRIPRKKPKIKLTLQSSGDKLLRRNRIEAYDQDGDDVGAILGAALRQTMQDLRKTRHASNRSGRRLRTTHVVARAKRSIPNFSEARRSSLSQSTRAFGRSREIVQQLRSQTSQLTTTSNDAAQQTVRVRRRIEGKNISRLRS